MQILYWLLSLKIPEEASVGDKLELVFNIKDDHNQGWSLKSVVKIINSTEKKKNKNKKKNKQSQNKGDINNPTGFSFPNVQWINKDRWPEHDFNELSALRIIRGETKELNGKQIESWDFFLNRNNKYLENELKTNRKGLHEEIILNRYRLAIVFLSLSLIDHLKKDKESIVEDDIARLTSGISPVILDVVDSVGELSETSSD